MGLTLGYRATPKWQHMLTLGDDQNRHAWHQPEPSHNTSADTFVSLFNQEARRRSVRYHTAYEAGLGEEMTARLTAGADYWSYDIQGSRASNLLNALGTIRTTSITSYSVTNDDWWNAGYFGMAELGWREALYVTLAGRVEDNPRFGEEYGRAFAPKVGAPDPIADGPVIQAAFADALRRGVKLWQIFDAVREVWPAGLPISVRISATDWVPGGFDADDAVIFAAALKDHGCDLIDVSTGQTTVFARPEYGRLYQTPFSDRIRHEVGIATMTVGAVSSIDDVHNILVAGRADLCVLARPHLVDPYWTMNAAIDLGYVGHHFPNQYLSGLAARRRQQNPVPPDVFRQG